MLSSVRVSRTVDTHPTIGGGPEAMTKPRTLIAIGAVVLALLLGLLIHGLVRERPSSLPQAADSPPAAAHSPNVTPLGIDCPTDPEPITDPVRIELVGHGLDMPIIQVGRDAEGAPASPPP